jgi:peptidoglycan/LPS O-acetylase OafA/YrhL
LLISLFLIGLILRFYVYQTHVEPFSDDDDWGFYWYKWIYYPTHSRLDGLQIGVGIAALCQFKPQIKARISKFGNLLLLIGFGILAAAYFLCSDQTTIEASVLGFPLISIGYGLMVFGAISPTSFLYTLSSKMTTFMATLSYSLYLTHKFLIHLTQELFLKWGFAQDSNWVFLICLFTSVLGAFLMNIMIEKPFLMLRNKILRKY